ncbi:MAG: HIT family protein [Myxococcales bacterium]|nr:HIT family protein [Myxococcales bacterium]
MNIELHPRLAADCHRLGQVPEGLVLLQRNASLPWFLLVPATPREQLHELDPELRHAVVERWNRLAAWVARRFDCTRVNVAAIGNVVPQLHLHVVGRRHDDPLWPGVPWGQTLPARAYSEATLASFQTELASALDLTPAPR